jgi:hypothetical protein
MVEISNPSAEIDVLSTVNINEVVFAVTVSVFFEQDEKIIAKANKFISVFNSFFIL